MNPTNALARRMSGKGTPHTGEGKPVLQRCTVTAIDAPSQTCTITFVGGTTFSRIPWVGYPPALGVAIAAHQPPFLYVLGNMSVSDAIPIGVPVGITQYGPAADPAYTINAANTLTALDTTNLTLPLTVPNSGRVLFIAELTVAISGTVDVWLAYLNHTGGAVIGVRQRVIATATALTYGPRVRYSVLATGLTPGSLQVDLAAAANGTATADMDDGSTPGATAIGPAILAAYAQ